MKQTDKHEGGQNNQMAGKLIIHVTKISREDLSPTAFLQLLISATFVPATTREERLRERKGRQPLSLCPRTANREWSPLLIIVIYDKDNTSFASGTPHMRL